MMVNERALKGIIFDLDGVLVNTVDLHYRAWKQLFDELGIPFSRKHMDRLRGIHQRALLLSLTEDLNETQVAVFLAKKDGYYRQVLAEARNSILLQPALELLREAQARGLKIGLASSSISARVVLNMVELVSAFDAIADGTTVYRSKPAPDIFIWVAGALGLHPSEIVVVEDGNAGVQGAVEAGMYVVGVGVETPAGEHPPHLCVSMGALSYESILHSICRPAQMADTDV